MANEVSIALVLTASKGGASLRNDYSKVTTMTGSRMTKLVQSVGTSTEALLFGEATSLGWLCVKNLDSTNYVELALDTPATTNVFAKLLPGEFILFPPKTSTIYALANTAPCLIEVSAIEL